ncbi:MAG: hypothetical protein KKB50_13275 [Planctomycetes bacterium]|nr:hypothetical protein [Planctomycetota bacterium]
MRESATSSHGSGFHELSQRRWCCEWTYLKAVVRKFRWLLLLLFFVLFGGAALFTGLYSDVGTEITFCRRLYYT